LEKARQVLARHQELLETMRQLRREMARCKGCSLVQECPLREEFNSQISAAVRELTEEWDLA